MLSRCNNPKAQQYEYYGGRGIKVCDEWTRDRGAFFDWAMSNGYAKGLSIDRIDVNGEYSPANCRWVTHKEQMNNTTKNVWVEFNGERKTVSQWADVTGLPDYTIKWRIAKGWTPEKALTKPLRKIIQPHMRRD
jgi:hypothetical protein